MISHIFACTLKFAHPLYHLFLHMVSHSWALLVHNGQILICQNICKFNTFRVTGSLHLKSISYTLRIRIAHNYIRTFLFFRNFILQFWDSVLSTQQVVLLAAVRPNALQGIHFRNYDNQLITTFEISPGTTHFLVNIPVHSWRVRNEKWYYFSSLTVVLIPKIIQLSQGRPRCSSTRTILHIH